MRSFLLFIFLFYFCCAANAQRLLLDNNMHHLRIGVNREWNEFPQHAQDSQIIIRFKSNINIGNATISLRQYDVNQAWQVLINDRKIGELTVDEKDMKSYFTIPPGLLQTGDNILYIGSPSATNDKKTEVSDDIRIGKIVLHNKSIEEVLSETTLEIRVSDGKTRSLIPSRITIVTMDGTLQQVNIKSSDTTAVRTGVIYTGNGKTSFGIPAGKYKIYASRGFEYGVDSVIVVLKPGDHIQKKLVINQEVDTKGWIGCDTHIHTLTYSGHGDATIEERVLTIAGEGLELPIITDHNIAIDIKPVAEKMRMDSFFVPVIGNEVTTQSGHFNIFPLDLKTPVTNHRAKNWDTLNRHIINTPGVKAVILNHARDIHNGFRPFDPKHHVAVAGKNFTSGFFPANAMEVMNSGSQQTDQLQLNFDWFGMINHGYFLTPVGSSDSHDVSRFIVGQARTYIKSTSDNVARIDVKEVLKNFTEGKVIVSFGLLTEIIVNKKYGPGDLAPASGKIEVTVKVSGPAWIKADHVSLYANGQKIREAIISPKTVGGIKWKGTWILPRPMQDLFLVAIAEGPGTNLPFWPIAKPFQHASPEWNPKFISSTGAVWIDADRDGHRTSAYEYAKAVWNSSNGNIHVLLKKLAHYDESVSVQAAAILLENGIKLQPYGTNRGFRRVINDMKKLEASRK